MKKVKWIGIFLLIATLTGCNGQEADEVGSEYVAQEVIYNTVDVYGEVQGNSEKEIVLGFPAIVSEIHVKEGQKLAKGDKIITLDFDEYMLQIEQQKLNIESYNMESLDPMIRATVLEVDLLNKELSNKRTHLHQGTSPQVQMLQDGIVLATDEYNQALEIYEANEALYEIGAVSAKEMEQYQLALGAKEVAIKDLERQIEAYEEGLQLEIDALNTQINVKNEIINSYKEQQSTGQQQLDYQIQVMELELQNMKNQINKTYLEENSIIAEEDGMVITGINVVEGSSITPMAGPVVKMVSVEPLEVKIEIPEDMIHEVSIGSDAEVVFYTPEGEDSYQGEVTWISESAIEKSGDTIIEGIVSLKEETDLKIGMSVEVIIEK